MKRRLEQQPVLDAEARTELRMARAAKGYNLDQLAAIIGTTKTTIHNLEVGRQGMSAELFSRLCKAVGLAWHQPRVILMPIETAAYIAQSSNADASGVQMGLRQLSTDQHGQHGQPLTPTFKQVSGMAKPKAQASTSKGISSGCLEIPAKVDQDSQVSTPELTVEPALSQTNSDISHVDNQAEGLI